MGKDPAFLFYPGDWNLGTMHLTLLEKGAYLELLMLQFAKGEFTLAHAKHMLKDNFETAWPSIKEKFITDGTYYWNKRLREEQLKRVVYTESRKKNASSPKRNREKNQEHMYEHMENVNENINKNEIKLEFDGISNVKFEKPLIEEIRNYCEARKNSVSAEKFYDFYESKGWMVGKNKMIDWKASLRTWESHYNTSVNYQKGRHPGQNIISGNIKSF
jgi:uncharacterized protein YdaU (DUF1376 family)